MKKNLLFNKLVLFFLVLVVLTILLLQAVIPLWRNHLIVDIWFYFERAKHFFDYRTLTNLIGNEHLPGALFYFFIPSLVFFFDRTLEIYTWAFFLLGFLFIAGHLFLYKRISGSPGILIFLLLLLFTGPILLFRFELAVSLLVLLSIYFFAKKKEIFSSFFLGVATTIKIYPMIILPYYLIIFFKNKQYQKLVSTLSFFVLGMAVVTGVYWLIGGSLKELLSSFQFHALKPLGLESPLTSPWLAYLKFHSHQLPQLIGAYGVWGINIDFLPVNLNFFNLLPGVMVFLFYLFIFFSKKLNRQFEISIVFLILLIFLFFSKNLNPQYLFWAFSLAPLLNVKKGSQKESIFVFIFMIVLLIGLLTQYVYPILYTDLINNFSQTEQVFTPVVYLLFLRNFLLLVLLIVSGRVFLFEKTTK